MAAGRHGGYRDTEFRFRESNFKLMHMEDLYYKGQEYDRYQNGGRDSRGERRHEICSSKEQDARESYRIVRKKEVIERVVVNGRNRLSSITSKSDINGGDNRRGGSFDIRVDQESCGLPTGILSANVDAPEPCVRDNEVSVSENRVESPACKKRKFSPNVLDREFKGRNSLKNKVFATSPKNPLLSKRNCQGAMSSPISPNTFHESQLSVSKRVVMPCSVESDVPALQTGLYPQEELRSSGHESGLLEKVDIIPRNILASRWADANCSPGDKDLVSDNGDMPRKRMSNTGSQSLDSSPELGELTRNGLEGLQTKSSEYVETEGFVESFGNGNVSVSNNLVEMKEDGSYHSDTDSEEKNCSPHSVEQVAIPQRSIDMLQGCRSVHEFERLNKIAEGTYGIVHRARDKRTGDVVALKKVKMDRENEGFPLTSLREINILLSSHHPSIVDVKEVVMDGLDNIFMVMEYMDHDLKGLMEARKQHFSQSEVKCLMLQLLEGVEYLHDNWIIHRDLKTSNILLNNRGELKICDFGLSRQYGSPLKPYTQLVVTLWYRAPELLLGAKQYSTAIDMWSVGCIMAELLANKPLFSGNSELDQIDKIFRTLGTPSEANWPGFSTLPGAKAKFNRHQNNLRKKFPPASFTGSPVLSEAGFDLLKKLLAYDPTKRITAHDAVNHEWFREVPLPKSKEIMPSFLAEHAQDRRQRRTMKSPDPLEEQHRRELQQGESGTGGLFS